MVWFVCKLTESVIYYCIKSPAEISSGIVNLAHVSLQLPPDEFRIRLHLRCSSTTHWILNITAQANHNYKLLQFHYSIFTNVSVNYLCAAKNLFGSQSSSHTWVGASRETNYKRKRWEEHSIHYSVLYVKAKFNFFSWRMLSMKLTLISKVNLYYTLWRGSSKWKAFENTTFRKNICCYTIICIVVTKSDKFTRNIFKITDYLVSFIVNRKHTNWYCISEEESAGQIQLTQLNEEIESYAAIWSWGITLFQLQ